MIARLAFVHLSRKWHWVVGLWSSVKKNCQYISIVQTFWTHNALWWSSVKMFVNLQTSLLQGSCLGSQWIWVWKPGGLAFWGCSELILPEWTPGLVAWHPWSWPLSMLMSLFLKAEAGLSPTWKGVSWKVQVREGHSHLRILLGKEQGVPVHWRAGSRALANVWASSVHPDECLVFFFSEG